MKKEKLSLEQLKERIGDYLYGKEHDRPYVRGIPSVKHYVWEQEGKTYSSWEINSGSHTMMTNDAGAKMFQEALMKEAKKYSK